MPQGKGYNFKLPKTMKDLKKLKVASSKNVIKKSKLKNSRVTIWNIGT